MPHSKAPVAAPPASTAFTPAESLAITTPAQLKAVSDPLRLEILETLLKEALTVKQVADRLGQPPTKLYYHVKALEKIGVVTIVETRVKSGIIEKYYRASAQSLKVDRQLFRAKGGDAFETVLGVVFDATVDDLRRSRAAGLLRLSGDPDVESSNVAISRTLLNLPPAAVPKAIAKLNALAKEWDYPEHPEDVDYGFTFAFYPRVTPAKKKKGKTK